MANACFSTMESLELSRIHGGWSIGAVWQEETDTSDPERTKRKGYFIISTDIGEINAAYNGW